MTNNNPYHEGELAVQARVKQTKIAQMNGRVITNCIPAGAIHFIEQQAMVVLGSLDSHGQLWCSAIFGEPGFLRAKDERTLELNLTMAGISKDDPLWTNLNANTNVGLIVIELGSRRRLRINGRLRKVSTDNYILDITQAYPNCPQYIQRRHISKANKRVDKNISPPTQGTELNSTLRSFIENSDTFFVASAHAEINSELSTNYSVDASHRGGQPGFVQIINNTLLRIPDYSGNSMFNTLGNFQSYPYAGLVFIDFKNKKLLQLTGTPEIIWQLDDPDEETGGTQRYWQFEIKAWQQSQIPFDIDWELLDYSPFNPKPVSSLDKTKNKLSLKVEKVTEETSRVKSFRLSDVNGNTLPEFQPGAHLKLKIKLEDKTEYARHYSLLSNPDEKMHYEIGVQLEPQGEGGSLYLHNHIHEGDILQVEAINNDFTMKEQAGHTILIAGGIGITPILSMLYKLAAQKQSYEIHYTVRNNSDLAFIDRIRDIAGKKLHCYVSSESNGSRLNLNQLLNSPNATTHVYVCGPRRMISSVRDISNNIGWQPSQIHYESFGNQISKEDRPFRIHLTKSNKSLNVPANRTILDTLLDAGLDVPHKCKRGECSMCTTTVLEGDPEHRDLCLNKEERTTSMCVCVSRAQGKELKLEL